MNPVFLVGLVFLAQTLISQTTLAEDHNSGTHRHHTAKEVSLELNEGMKWPTDEPLRSGMLAIKASTEKQLEAIHKNKLAAPEAKNMAGDIKAQLNNIFQKCKLEPKADAMLHLVLVQIVRGANGLEIAKTDQSRQSSALEIINALNSYGKFFDHPGWKDFPEH